MYKNTFFLIATCFLVFDAFAQNTSTQLEELIIEKSKISTLSKSQNLIVLNDSLIEKTVGTFTEFLQKNTTIYFKENGYGMVSSPAFRGTTAQQTSVLWNGIKVNSALLGQTDFNATAFKNFDNIVVKPGGGSVLYGSGAVGGTIHLNNELHFNETFKNQLQLNYGSFNTTGLHYKATTGTKLWALNVHLGFNKSANDFEWIGKNRKNLNGAFHNSNLGFETAFKLNQKNTLAFYSATYADDRHFALVTPYQTKTKYQNNNYRNLLKWNFKNNQFLNILSAATIQEQYSYFDKLPSESKSGGKATIFSLKNESYYNVTNSLKFSGILEYQQTKGNGTNSNLPYANQEIFGASLLGNYKINNGFGFESGIKTEITNAYSNPFLYSAGLYFNTKNYQLKVNTSKNYRIPTFNDLYWQPGGNLNLKPETSNQIDINHNFKLKAVTFNISTYYINLKDMIRWIPTASGFWEANNTDAVTIYGSDFYFNLQKKWLNNYIQLTGNYGFNQSTNKKTNTQLTYTPKHKFSTQFVYGYKNFSVSPSFMYVGKIYTTTSNTQEDALATYGIVAVDFQQKINIKNTAFYLNFKIKNLANTTYTTMPEQQMPGRNFHIQILTKF